MPGRALPAYSGTVEDRLRLEEYAWIQKLFEHKASARPIDRSTVDEITPQCCYDVKEVHLDTRTLVDLILALYPITPTARRCDACQDRPPLVSDDCDACNRLYNARRLFDACCEIAAANIYPKVTDDTWQDSSSMWQLIRSELPTETPLSQDLVEIISSWVVAREMSSLQLVHMYRIRGGLTVDRHKGATERSGAFYLINTVEHGAEKVLFLYKSFDACVDIPWTKIQCMTELGDKRPYASGAQTVTLPSPFDEALTTFHASEEELGVTLHPASIRDGIVWSQFTEEGKRSLRWILENHARRSCVIQWPSQRLDANDLPGLPATIKALKLCGMLQFLGNRVPPSEHSKNVGYQHWMHGFAAKLKHIEHLSLSGCGYESQDLVNLHRWLPSLKHIQVTDDDWIVKDGVLLVAPGSDESWGKGWLSSPWNDSMMWEDSMSRRDSTSWGMMSRMIPNIAHLPLVFRQDPKPAIHRSFGAEEDGRRERADTQQERTPRGSVQKKSRQSKASRNIQAARLVYGLPTELKREQTSTV